MSIDDPANPGIWIDYTVPAGSKIIIEIHWYRAGVKRSCEMLRYDFSKTYISSSDYNNMYDWFIGDNIQATLNQGSGNWGAPQFNPTLGTNVSSLVHNIGFAWMQFFRVPQVGGPGQLILAIGTGKACNGIGYFNSRKFCVNATINVYRATSLLIFETEPSDALPDVFFENNLSFEIDDQGNHMGNITNQDIANGVAGKVDTGFFNCFSFGNGAESYKIRDSLIGRQFNLGERVNSVAAQEYKEAERFADITYSGVYNAETNVNKLNEFNLGLLDYKNL